MGTVHRTGLARILGFVAGVLIFAGCSEHHFEDPYAEGEIAVPDDLYAAAAVGKNHFWASGYFGSIYRTTDAGASWKKLDTDTDKPIYGISFADEKIGWAVGQRGFIVRTQDGGMTWEHQFTPRKPARHMFAVHAIDTQNVWAVSDWGGIYKTTNGGESWEDLSFTVDDTHPTFKYLNEAELAAYERGEKVYDDVYLNDIYFTDLQHGWIAAEYGLIFRTSDGGQTWEKGKVQGDVNFPEVNFPSMESKVPRDLWDALFEAAELLVEKQYLRVRIEGFMTAAEYATRGDTFLADERAEKIRDFLEGEGVTQDRLRVLNPTPFDEESVDMNAFRAKKFSSRRYAKINVIETPFLFDVKFKDSQNGVITGLGGVVLTSADGGATWQYAETDSHLAFFSGAFAKDRMIVVGDRGQQRARTTGGWAEYDVAKFPETFGYMRDVVFGDENHGWIVGAEGFILRSSNGGDSWEQVKVTGRQSASNADAETGE